MTVIAMNRIFQGSFNEKNFLYEMTQGTETGS